MEEKLFEKQIIVHFQMNLELEFKIFWNFKSLIMTEKDA